MSDLSQYTSEDLAEARTDALGWLVNNADGYPRSYGECERLGWGTDLGAPVIAGYEALEREGIVERVGEVKKGRQTRVHFRLADREAALQELRKTGADQSDWSME